MLFRCERMDCVSLMRHSKDWGVVNRDYRKKKVLYFIDEDRSDDFDAVYFAQRARAKGSKQDVEELESAKDAAKQREVSQEVIVQQILDKIHCFLCHSLTAPPIGTASGGGGDAVSSFYGGGDGVGCGSVSDGDLVGILHGIFSAMPEYRRIRNIRSNRHDAMFSKFTTKLTPSADGGGDAVAAADHKMEDIDDDEVGPDGAKLTAQSGPNWIGRNFVYDFIEPKYGNLKEEMLSGYGLGIGASNLKSLFLSFRNLISHNMVYFYTKN